MRVWLLTNTTYGTWLPGDRRGSVTSVRDRRISDGASETRVEHDRPGEPWEPYLPALNRSAKALLKGPPIYMQLAQAELLLQQFQETARYRGWETLAVSIMANHFHLVVRVKDDPDPDRVLADFKAYGTRALNRAFGKPASETWWTGKGSKRKLPNERAITGGVDYVLYKQAHPLVVWSPELGRIV
jgi:REP element-mobilizing transposase RayT